jgi:Nif-specific regulatory protein
LVTGQLLATKQPMTIENLQDHPDFYGRPPHDLENLSLICIPILDSQTGVSGQRLALGTLCADLAKAPPVFLERQRSFLEVVALAVALVVMRLREEMSRPAPKPKAMDEPLGEVHKSRVIAVSKSIRLVLRQIEQAAQNDSPVIFLGEDGTGKEYLAQALHNQSHRRKKPFQSLGCASEPSEAVEKLLFGVQKGEVSNSSQSKRGLLELALGGTLFLEDVDALSPRAQHGLLRLIQEGVSQRLGSDSLMNLDVRIVAASHANLDDLMNTGAFLEDLYYALSVVPIYVPPLRERAGDILPLAEYFLQEMAQTTGKSFKRISTPAIDLLNQYHWPDNVRELKSCMERAFEQCEEGVIRAYHLPPVLQTAESSNTESELSFGEAVDQFEKELLVEALKKAKGNMYQAAKDLRDSYRIINYKVKKHNIDPKRFTPGKRR